MAGASIKAINTGIQDNLTAMLDRQHSMQAYLDRIVYRQYQNAQRERWMSEGASEGVPWDSLNPAYASRKLIKFASYDGGGRKMLIATGRLFKSVIGPGEDHQKVATNDELTVSWSTEYAPYVNQRRTFDLFSLPTMEKMYDGLARFLILGIMRDTY